MTTELSGKVALVTGSTRGLGKEIALELARRGARVAMNYAGDREAAEGAFADLRTLGGEHCLVRADVTDEAGVDALVRDVAERLGAIGVLVLNATCDQPMKPIEEYDWAFAQRMVDFFIKSPFLLTQACLPSMRAQRWGRIVHVTSEVFTSAPTHYAPYVAAKGGQIGLVKSCAAELAPLGITVNAVAPGWIPVERNAGASDQEKRQYLATNPAGRFGAPEDIAAAVAYLASDAARFVNGASIDVNGGRTIR